MKPGRHLLGRQVVLLTALLLGSFVTRVRGLEMARLAVIDCHLSGGLPCGDANNNGRYEVYGTGYGDSIFAYEYLGRDSCRRIFIDKIAYCDPWEFGDGDRDGRAELIVELFAPPRDRIIESPNHWAYPRDSTWQVRVNTSHPGWPRFVDLNRNGRMEVAISVSGWGIHLFENNLNNQYESLAVLPGGPPYGSLRNLDTCDFDRDGRCELVAGDFYGDPASMWFFSSTGRPDSPFVFSAICSIGMGNLICVAAGPDMDRDGWPEVIAVGATPDSVLLMIYQATAPARYERVWSQLAPSPGWYCNISVGDVDGDGVEEFAYNAAGGLIIYKATARHEYEAIWRADSGGIGLIRLFDINRDGRAEVIFPVGTERCEIWGDTERLAISEIWKRPGSVRTALVQPTVARTGAPVWLEGLTCGATLEIVNSNGRLVRTGQVDKCGRWQWDLRDERGVPVPVGTYCCVVRARGQSTSLKLCIVK